jgi:hypothetical protein
VSAADVPDNLLSRLMASLTAIASEPSDQLALFPESISRAGDLAARVDESLRAVRDDAASTLSREQAHALEALSARLTTISRDGAEFDPDLWTDEALRTSVHWRDVRALARAAIDRFELANADRIAARERTE